MSGIRESLQKPAVKTTAIVLALVAIGAAVWVSLSNTANPAADANTRWFVDSKTMQPFRHTLVRGETTPIDAPSGGKTGYPAELCFWTADGKSKAEPTPVLLNEATGKPGPTFCPDCGRMVRYHNPAPAAGVNPPPKKGETGADAETGDR
jgi:hypothetical protein